MNAKQSAELKVGARVIWEGDRNDAGTVIGTGYHAICVKWDNGQTGTIDHRDAAPITTAAA